MTADVAPNQGELANRPTETSGQEQSIGMGGAMRHFPRSAAHLWWSEWREGNAGGAMSPGNAPGFCDAAALSIQIAPNIAELG